MLKYKYILLILIFLSTFSFNLNGQQVMTLEACVLKAQNTSLSLKKMNIAGQSIALNYKLAKAARYPSLNFSGSGGFNFGRTVDPTSNSFSNSTIGFNQYSLSTAINIYNGGKVEKNIQKTTLDKLSSLEDYKQLENDISLAVANIYLQILFSEENLNIQKNNLAQTDLQKQKLQKMVDLGARPEGDLINLDYQLAQNYQQIVSLENNVKSLYLDLRQFMDLSIDEEILIVHPELPIENIELETRTNQDIFKTAVSNQPFIKSAEYKVQSAEQSIKIAKADLLPSVSFFGSINSNYSSLGKKVDGFTTVPFQQNVLINGAASELVSFQNVPLIEDAGFFNQLNSNLGQTAGLRVSIPIYNQSRVKVSIERSKLNLESLQIENKEKRDKLRKDINRAILDIDNARSEYDAAKLGYEAAVLLLDNATKKYDLGIISSYDFDDAKNKKESAERQWLITKYKYLFNNAILDFYLGKPLNFG